MGELLSDSAASQTTAVKGNNSMTVLHRFAITVALTLVGFAIPTVAHAASNQALCASRGTIDDAKPIPRSLGGFATTLFGEDAHVVYRCMHDQVYFCDLNVNQTMGCDKADTRRNIPEVIQFCKEEPNASFVPMASSGHRTIYSWRCVHGRPAITSADKVDERGFQAQFWILIGGLR